MYKDSNKCFLSTILPSTTQYIIYMIKLLHKAISRYNLPNLAMYLSFKFLKKMLMI